MKSLLKKNELRQLNLIEILYISINPISISEMASKLDYSDRAITLDIIDIQDKFPFLNIMINNQKITMDIAPNYNLSYVYQFMFKHNTGVQLLEHLFLNKHTTLEDLTDQLEVSQATVYRLITQVNDAITSQYDIKVETNPFHIKGDEGMIRVFFTQLYSDIYNLLEWPFVNTNEEGVTDLIFEVTTALNIPINYIGVHYMKYLVAVSLVRLKNGYYVDMDRERAVLIYKTLYSNTIDSVKLKQIMTRLGLSLNQPTMEQLFYVVINSDYIFANSKLINTSKYIDKRIESFNNLNYVIETLRSEFNLEFDNPGFLILKLHNAVALNRQDIDSENIIHDNKSQFIEDLSHYFPDFISRASQLFQEYCLKMEIEWDVFLKDHLIYQLFIQWNKLYTQLVENKQFIKIAIVCKYDISHAFFLKEYFELHFGSKLHFNVYNDSTVSIDHLEKIPEVIILSTFHIPQIEGKHVININFFPSLKDIDKLFVVLNREKPGRITMK